MVKASTMKPGRILGSNLFSTTIGVLFWSAGQLLYSWLSGKNEGSLIGDYLVTMVYLICLVPPLLMIGWVARKFFDRLTTGDSGWKDLLLLPLIGAVIGRLQNYPQTWFKVGLGGVTLSMSMFLSRWIIERFRSRNSRT
jgi:uncharacterized membrane protein YhaH (DUF805 family)